MSGAEFGSPHIFTYSRQKSHDFSVQIGASIELYFGESVSLQAPGAKCELMSNQNTQVLVCYGMFKCIWAIFAIFDSFASSSIACRGGELATCGLLPCGELRTLNGWLNSRFLVWSIRRVYARTRGARGDQNATARSRFLCRGRHNGRSPERCTTSCRMLIVVGQGPGAIMSKSAIPGCSIWDST